MLASGVSVPGDAGLASPGFVVTRPRAIGSVAIGAGPRLACASFDGEGSTG